MKQLSESQILEIASKSISKIKNTENPYKNLSFVDKIFEGCDALVIEGVKGLVKQNFKGQLRVNLFESANLSPAHHLYNYLYEHNLLSKYNSVAEYMNYPSATQLKKK
jgi:hypothetical protein